MKDEKPPRPPHSGQTTIMGESDQKRLSRKVIPLLALGGLGLLFVFLIPWLRHMAEETARIERVAQAEQEETTRKSFFLESLSREQVEIVKHPDDAAGHIHLATGLDAIGRLKEAKAEMLKGYQLRPNDLDAALLLADLYQRDHDYDEAYSLYRKTLAAHTDSERALSGLSALYLILGWTQEARSLLKDAVKRFPDNLSFKVALAQAYVQHLEFGEAEHMLLEVRRRDPQRAAMWKPLVDFYLKSARFKEAIQTANDALALLPNDIPLLNALANAYYELNETEKAKQMSLQVLKIEPDSLIAHQRLALCYKRENRLEEAKQELEYNFKKYPDFGNTRLLLAEIYTRLNRATEAAPLRIAFIEQKRIDDEYKKVGLYLSMHPGEAKAHWEMAQFYKMMGNLQRARIEAHRTIELDPSQAGARAMLLTISQKRKKP